MTGSLRAALSLSIALLAGCNESSQPGSPVDGSAAMPGDMAVGADGADFAVADTDGAFCPGSTPGIVRCGSGDCDVAHGWECSSCTSSDPLTCRAPGYHCDSIFENRRCDGAEDCPAGQVCALFEGTWCSKPPATGTLCRCGKDCGPAQTCRSGMCG